MLNALQEPGSIDELGVGVVCDVMAARLVPDTLTLLIRARYFFLTTYLMKYMEQGRDKKRHMLGVSRSEYQNPERRRTEGHLICEAQHEGIVGSAPEVSRSFSVVGIAVIGWVGSTIRRVAGMARRTAAATAIQVMTTPTTNA